MVREKGLEPPRISPLVSKTKAAAITPLPLKLVLGEGVEPSRDKPDKF